MSTTAWFVASLGSALELGLATPDDVLRHVTADVLAQQLPRPLWARLLTASLGAGRLDATLVVDTVGIENLCEHAPKALLWQVLADVAARSLTGAAPALRPSGPALLSPAPAPAPVPAAALLAPVPVASGPAIPNPASGTASGTTPGSGAASAPGDGATETEGMPIARPRTASQRFRPSNTGLTRATPPSAPPSANSAGASSPPSSSSPRRPQAAAAVEAPAGRQRRVQTEVSDYDIATDVRSEGDWRSALAPSLDVDVEDEQLVDWAAASEETVDRKR